jgi:hypothetical protein
MSGKLHFPQSKEQDNKAKIEQLGTPATPYGKRRSSLWSARLQRYVAFLLVVLLSVATLIALSKGAVPSPGQASVTRPGTSLSTGVTVSTTSGTVAPTTEALVQAAQTVTTQVPKRPVKVDHGRQQSEQRAWGVLASA